ncbi:glycoside hydrolase family 32 protein [Streptomyces camelliae]|uniref:GH32 C-terminal domain-containing protein n=1 Tax=Streptomyces camelliae TaxID=3004093 RepID=A0ABY7PCB1_9ACTN|nr:GH32 C-terminal domain-containing protein [Streptomyces sp. HUAS 2-6]WBO68259.1 GH32 C-terminal domain-containing protein [Streptomyces sp. HUAS 2-6]
MRGPGLTRRALFTTTAAGAGAALLPAAPADARPRPKVARDCLSYRAGYHFTVPDQWKNDPQRPVWIDGEYHYYYLYNADYLAGGEVGTAWRLATSADLVRFTDRGIAVPKDTTVNGDVWSGSAVVDTGNTAGFGAGAVVVVVTMSPGGGTDHQEQFLYYSTDGGLTFTNYGTDPVLPSPGTGADFRDPKVSWDADRNRWTMALAERDTIGFYHSPDLKSWTRDGGFVKDGIGVLECPDLFRITADDGTATWVLGASADGTGSGQPNTYAYWTGSFDGGSFTPDSAEPQWLDHGWDWYAAVTFDKRRADGSVDPAARYALGWLNDWAYAHTTPTIDADGFNGTDSVVREITLKKSNSGGYYLASQPVAALDTYVSRTVNLGDLTVDGTRPLDYTGVSYELTTEITWSQLTGAGVQLRRSPDGGRHIDAGIWNDYAFLNRRGTVNPDTSGVRQESHSPFDPSAGRVKLRILVDRTSVEMFVDDGRYVHTSEVFPYLVDNRLALFTAGGTAVFRDTVIREFTV